MAYTGLLKHKRICAICTKQMPKGTLVYFDATKSVGNHVVHKKCLDDLNASREERPTPGKEVKSHEELDPPF